MPVVAYFWHWDVKMTNTQPLTPGGAWARTRSTGHKIQWENTTVEMKCCGNTRERIGNYPEGGGGKGVDSSPENPQKCSSSPQHPNMLIASLKPRWNQKALQVLPMHLSLWSCRRSRQSEAHRHHQQLHALDTCCVQTLSQELQKYQCIYPSSDLTVELS